MWEADKVICDKQKKIGYLANHEIKFAFMI